MNREGPGQPVHAQSDQGFHCPLIESLDTTGYMTGDQKAQCPAYTQNGLIMRILRMFKGTFFA